MIDLERRGDVFVPGMRAGENRFNPGFLERYGGAAAQEAGIVDAAAAEERVLDQAGERAQALAAKASPVMATLKRGLYARALEILEARP